jgi:hypothetical protein
MYLVCEVLCSGLRSYLLNQLAPFSCRMHRDKDELLFSGYQRFAMASFDE